MRMNVRYINIEKIKIYLNKNIPMEELFDAESFIFQDKVSSMVYDLFKKGLSNEEIKNKIGGLDGQKS